MPLATAIITVFNEETFIKDAVLSLLNQSLTDIEVIVVDDGSSDRTVEIVRQIDDSRLRLEQPGRLGRASALAYATSLASGKYVANLDADDEAFPERLKLQSDFPESHADFGWVGGAEERDDSQRGEYVIRRYAEDDRDIRRQAAKCIPYSHSAIMFRRSLVEQGINYDPKQKYLIDFELFIRIARVSKVANLPEVVAKRRVRSESYFQSTYSRSKQKRRMAFLCSKAIREFGLPSYYYAYPLMHLGYPFIPKMLQRRIRAMGGISETRLDPT